MSTKVYNYYNSFIEIKTNSTRIFLDPLISNSNSGAWAGLKSVFFNSLQIDKYPVDIIWISHFHSDHYDENFILKILKSQKFKPTIIIKLFKDGRFKQKLLNLGIAKNKIIELKEYKKYNIKEFHFLQLPQISASTSPESNKLVNYDLDSSVIISNHDLKIYNQTDNPYTPKDLEFVLNKSKKYFDNQEFDLAFLPYCGASEYPQSYINLNRNDERKKIVEKMASLFIELSKSIKSKYYIPAGGTYKLNGPLNIIDKYKSVPSFKELSIKINSKMDMEKVIDPRKKFFSIEKRQVKINNIKYKLKESINFSLEDFFYHNKNYNIPFESNSILPLVKEMELKIPIRIKSLFLNFQTNVIFNLYNQFPINNNGNLNVSLNPITFSVFNKMNKPIFLKIHIYYKTFFALIFDQAPWDELKFHCLYERLPNIYDADTGFWLNLYKFRKS